MNALNNRNTGQFWSLWKSKLGTTKKLQTCINGKNTEQDIAQEFANYFATVCTSNSIERSRQLKTEYSGCKSFYEQADNIARFSLSVEQVDRAITKLKFGKSPGCDKITAEHIRHCHPIIVLIITRLFNAMLLFEYVPDGFGVGIMVPIPKSETDLDKTDNYRGITLNPIVSKLFEHCLLEIFSRYLRSSDMQFGFKAKSGCNKALYTVRKTIEYFIDRDTTVNLCALDMAKAFDKMNKHALFIKLMNNHCPLTLINILDCWYAKSYACVRWGDAMSSLVQMNSGTRQGGVCSPALFAVFINDLLIKLQKSSLGCHIRNICFNACMFADDLLLLAICITDLNEMINICKAELDWLDMRINVKKSTCIRIGNRFNVTTCSVKVEGNALTWATEIKYLGLYIMAGRAFRCNTHCPKVKYFRSLNCILGKVGTMTAINVILSLISTNCNPILLYGLEATRLGKSQLNSLNYPFNSGFMKLFNTFDPKVIAQTQFYCGCLPFSYLLDSRILSFYSDLKVFDHQSPASILYFLFGENEWNETTVKYNITKGDNSQQCYAKIWTTFQEEIQKI